MSKALALDPAFAHVLNVLCLGLPLFPEVLSCW